MQLTPRSARSGAHNLTLYSSIHPALSLPAGERSLCDREHNLADSRKALWINIDYMADLLQLGCPDWSETRIKPGFVGVRG